MIESLDISLKSFESRLVHNALQHIISSLSCSSSLDSFSFSVPQKQKRFTVLRSPHVHKKSREQFHVQSFKTILRVKTKSEENHHHGASHELALFLENLKYFKLLGVHMKIQVSYTTFL